MKNKKIILSIPFICAFFPNITLADEQPHVVLTANCLAGQTCCPTAVYCSYKEGTCGNAYNWYVSGNLAQAFIGVQKFELFQISSYPLYNSLYQINCSYGYPGNQI